MFKKFNYLVAAVIIMCFAAICCGGEVEDYCSPTNKSCSNKAKFTILMDDNLSDDHKLLISTALAEWDIKTNQSLNYVIKYKDMSKVPNDLSGDFNTIKIFILDPGPGNLGWTEWQTDNNTARILLHPDLNQDNFYPTILHELGHAFHIGHYVGKYKSIMRPSIGNTNQLECTDIVAFCKIWDCQATCSLYDTPQYSTVHTVKILLDSK